MMTCLRSCGHIQKVRNLLENGMVRVCEHPAEKYRPHAGKRVEDAFAPPERGGEELRAAERTDDEVSGGVQVQPRSGLALGARPLEQDAAGRDPLPVGRGDDSSQLGDGFGGQADARAHDRIVARLFGELAGEPHDAHHAGCVGTRD